MSQVKFFFTLLTVLVMASCQKEILNEPQITAEAQASTHTVTSVNFAAVAIVANCVGHNIRFAGQVEFKTTTVRNEDGSVRHFTRTWSIKGLQATSWSSSSASSGSPVVNGEVTNYEVVAGAEMFSVHEPSGATPGTPANAEVFIHQGTLVLQNTATGDKMVVRHEIVKNPNGMVKNGWYIRGEKCS